jgi:hypothetical protein
MIVKFLIHNFYLKTSRITLVMPSENLDEKSFENLVRFHEGDLRRVLEGEEVDEVFTKGDRGKLSSAGVLRYVNAT